MSRAWSVGTLEGGLSLVDEHVAHLRASDLSEEDMRRELAVACKHCKNLKPYNSVSSVVLMLRCWKQPHRQSLPDVLKQLLLQLGLPRAVHPCTLWPRLTLL